MSIYGLNLNFFFSLLADQQEVAREISDAISNPTAFSSEFDDDDLEAELEALELEAQTDEQVRNQISC